MDGRRRRLIRPPLMLGHVCPPLAPEALPRAGGAQVSVDDATGIGGAARVFN
jgi:hypothetical protein